MTNPQNILIIEDDVAIVDFMTEALKEDGYSVRSAQNGEQGLNEIEHSPPALVLLDLHMPGITATEFLERLHANHLLSIPVVIMTADKNALQYLDLVNPWDVTLLSKPFDLDTLLAYVARYIPPPVAPRH